MLTLHRQANRAVLYDCGGVQVFNRIMYVTLFASDQDRALEFYTKSFGFHKRVDYT
jgi:predicted enzyme related to lactoylglutathione lyase